MLYAYADHINLIMVAYHRANDLKRCVDSVLSNTQAKFRLCIIDNSLGAIDATLDTYRSCDNVVIYKNDSNLGKPRAVNRWYDKIMLRSRAGYFVSIDSDVVVKPGWLCELIRSYVAVSRHVKVGLMAPIIQDHLFETWQWQLDNKVRMHNTSIMREESSYKGVYYNRYTAGPVLLINKYLFEDIGGFYDKQLYGADDGQLCKTCDRKGYFIGLNTNVSVLHSQLDVDELYVNWKARNVRGDVDGCGRWDYENN